jgi:hypothetical protein
MQKKKMKMNATRNAAAFDEINPVTSTVTEHGQALIYLGRLADEQNKQLLALFILYLDVVERPEGGQPH